MNEQRLASLTAALGFLSIPPRAPELQLLHRWPDTWNGIGLIAVGMHRHRLRLSLSHIADGEWRCYFRGDGALLAPRGYGVASTPWRAVQIAAWAAVNKEDRR